MPANYPTTYISFQCDYHSAPRVYFLEALCRYLLRTERMPSSIKTFVERPRSIANFLISLIKVSSRVVVNFFLLICRPPIFVLRYVRQNAISVPPYIRIYGKKIPRIGILFHYPDHTSKSGSMICYQFHW